MTETDFLQNYITELTDTLGKLIASDIEKAIDIIWENRKNTIFCFGNGGSAATASHLVNDLRKMCGIRAFCLTDNIPTLTAYANDIGYWSGFMEQLHVLAKQMDVLFGISCSGSSQNVVNAMFAYRDHPNGILLTGNIKRPIAHKKFTVIHVDHHEITIQESVHSAICHAIVMSLKERLK